MKGKDKPVSAPGEWLESYAKESHYEGVSPATVLAFLGIPT